MFNSDQICPYTGLRSFTEEESLYFKGREEDIEQATIQLQKNKFLMLTGASGDGKSSLIYAGIIPNARAGFLKSKYTQWCVADFRPERTPFSNLVFSIARELGIADIDTVSSELSHGFSALVDLYKNSPRYVDTNSVAWSNADEKGRAAIKREAANLIILADQFEEFFTNPENYQHGQPSRESNLVLNLLLETARISLEEDLPIYVVFTMRSDYIGQCASFRGLPEYLGFSQYFVPRLNRVQLQQVIEEPAVLSGNRISRRLTERLIHDITEGVDQLPILQHALNQIWLAADSGRQEMDLLHYAMVGGMGKDELQDGEAALFEQWFVTLRPEIKACYLKPSLQNVLDTHTNKLYEQAAEYFSGSGQELPASEVKEIIRTTFTCLTKIDQGRAVRNRMTLQEVTDVIGKPGIGTEQVCNILNIFREPGNTFIHPFISADHPDSNVLAPGQVLDITHESLIRNWRYLGDWAKEEFESRAISLDFEKQLGRWVDSGKSRNFLLPIGPLTYFENWFVKAKPNAHWIARYLPEDSEKDLKITEARQILGDSREFLQKSASKHAITRAIMKIGTRRIAAAFGALALILLSSFGIRNYFSRQDSSVLRDIKEEGLSLATSNYAAPQFKVSLALELYKQGLADPYELIKHTTDDVSRAKAMIGFATQLTLQGFGTPKEPTVKFISIADSIIAGFRMPDNDPELLRKMLKQINDLRGIVELAYGYTADPRLGQIRDRNASRSTEWALKILALEPKGFSDMNEWAVALENGLNYQKLNADAVRQVLLKISPYENSNRSPWVKNQFLADRIMERGEQNYGFSFNGLYQQLAYLYAAEGKAQQALSCIDSLLKYSSNYYQGDYAACADNAANISYVFYRYGNHKALDSFTAGYCLRKKITEEDFYARVMGRMARERATAAGLSLYFWMNNKLNFNTRFAADDDMGYFSRKYREAINLHPDPEHRKLYTAISYKNEGILKTANASKVAGEKTDILKLFDTAMAIFSTVDPAFTEQLVTVIKSSGADEMNVPLRYLFIYPDYRTEFHPLEPRSFFLFYLNESFMKYILDKNLFRQLYAREGDLSTVVEWLYSCNVKMFAPSSFLAKTVSTTTLENMRTEIEKINGDKQLNFNFLYLMLGFDYQANGDTVKMLEAYRKVRPENILNLLGVKEYGNNPNGHTMRILSYAVKGLAESGNFSEAEKLIKPFKKNSNRSTLYAFAAAEVYASKRNTAIGDRLLDSARAEAARIRNVQGTQFNREAIAAALAFKAPGENKEEIERVIKNLPAKNNAFSKIAEGYALHGQLYNANGIRKNLAAEDEKTLTLFMLLYGKQLAGATEDGQWDTFNKYYLKLITQSIVYDDESN